MVELLALGHPIEHKLCEFATHSAQPLSQQTRDSATVTDQQIESTGPLFLNGDKKLNPINKIRYFMYHGKRNRIGNRIPYAQEDFWPRDVAACRPSLDELLFDRTPARMACNLFWQQIDWDLVRAELGEVRIHDIGCGRGRYGELISEFAGYEIDYNGFDIISYPEWDTYKTSSVRFHLYDGFDFASTLTFKPNFFMSQSALEHVPGDLGYFRTVSKYIDGLDRSLQIHMLPGETGLKQWGLHGWRHYSRDSLRLIASTFGPGVTMTAVGLGGPSLVDLHFKWIHNRKRLKSIKRESAAQATYKTEWVDAICKDTAVGIDQSCFLALVIEKGFDAPLWPRLMRRMDMAFSA